jgi:hypothetical protein
MPWKLTVRIGPRVERTKFDDREQALDALQARARELTRTARTKGVDLKYKRYEPSEQVSARIELSGPERLLPSVQAGIDVRGDGSTQAFVGRVRREVVEPRKGESAAQALRRILTDGSRS